MSCNDVKTNLSKSLCLTSSILSSPLSSQEADNALLRNLEYQIQSQFLQDDINFISDRQKKVRVPKYEKNHLRAVVIKMLKANNVITYNFRLGNCCLGSLEVKLYLNQNLFEQNQISGVIKITKITHLI